MGPHRWPASTIYFIVGLLWIWIALETLDGLRDQYLQSAHMAQHMILMAFAPPFLLLGLTPTMARRLLRIPGWPLGRLSKSKAGRICRG